MAFDQFKQAFEEKYQGDIYDFVDEIEFPTEDTPPFGAKLEADLDEISHDSYGNEDSDLRRIYFIKDFDIYVEFYGNRSSYQGEEWYGYKEVVKKEKTISVWEQMK